MIGYSLIDSHESDGEDIQVNGRFKKIKGYHAVPPPYRGNYMPPRVNLSFAGLDDSVFESKVSETITSVPKTETNASKTSKDSLEKHKIIRSSAPIIKELESNSKDENVVEKIEVKKTIKPTLEKIEFVNARNTTVENESKAEKSRKLRYFNHLIKNYDFHENKIVEKSVLKNKGKNTGLKENRPVWDNTARVNHQNKLTHPHPKRKFVRAAVLTKSGLVPVNAAKQSSHRAAASASAARHVNIVAPKPYSPVKRSFNQKSAAKTNNFYKKVSTAKVNKVTTAGTKAVVSAAEGKRGNVVKSSATSSGSGPRCQDTTLGDTAPQTSVNATEDPFLTYGRESNLTITKLRVSVLEKGASPTVISNETLPMDQERSPENPTRGVLRTTLVALMILVVEDVTCFLSIPPYAGGIFDGGDYPSGSGKGNSKLVCGQGSQMVESRG
nr:hypothetical protein [Tanacetum cinerariifolium]